MNRILVIKLSSLGDLFHALPTVRVLKEGLDARIDWAVQSEYTGIVELFDDVDRTISVPRRHLRTHGRSFLNALRQSRYDYVIDLQGLMKSALVTAAARGGRKIGPSARREGATLFYHEKAGSKNKQRHACEELLDAARHLGLTIPEHLSFPVTFPDHAGFGPGLHVALCPRSRAKGKDWPAERFIETARLLLCDQPNVQFHLVGGPQDRETCNEVATAIGPKARNHAGQTTLPELGSLLKMMDLVITVDSGPMHMAAAIGTPTLALFGPTSPLRTGPYGTQHCVIESTFHPEQKNISKKTRQTDMRYIEAIQVEEVVPAAVHMLDRDAG